MRAVRARGDLHRHVAEDVEADDALDRLFAARHNTVQRHLHEQRPASAAPGDAGVAPPRVLVSARVRKSAAGQGTSLQGGGLQRF